MCVGARGYRRVIQTPSITASALPFASLTAPKKFAIRVFLRTLIIYHNFLLGSSTISPKAHKPENCHAASLTGLEAHDTGIYFLCVLVGVPLRTREAAGAECPEGEGCALWERLGAPGP